MFGAFGVIWVCSILGPRLLKLDLRKEAERLEQQYGIDRDKPGMVSGWRPFDLRAFRITPQAVTRWRHAGEPENSARPARLFIVRLRRGGTIREGDASLELRPDDIVAISGPRETLVDLAMQGLEEVTDRELLDVSVAVADVFLTAKEFDGQTVGAIADREQDVRGVYLRKITRGGQDVPLGLGTVLERGDVLRLIGPEAALNRVGARIGAVISPTDAAARWSRRRADVYAGPCGRAGAIGQCDSLCSATRALWRLRTCCFRCGAPSSSR